MQQIKTIIIDDEPANIDVLQKSIQQYCPSVQVVATATNIVDAEKLIAHHAPQLLLLDVEMPNGNGFDLLQKLMPLPFNVVFTTAFNKYAVQAFKFSAIDYLLKPIDPIELIAAVQKVALQIEKNENHSQHLQQFFNNYIADPPKKKIAINDTDGTYFLDISQIIHIVADSNYTTIYLHNNKKKVVIKPLSEFEETLPKQMFFRTHHSHIVNINYIKKYHKGRGGFVEMENDAKVEVAVRKRDEFLKMLNN